MVFSFDDPKPSSSGQGMDQGLASILSEVMGSAPAGSGGGMTEDPLTLSDLEGLLMGTVRSSISPHPFTGGIPAWVPKSVRGYVRKGVIDPYLGAGNPDTYRVYMGRTKPTPGTPRTVTYSHAGGAEMGALAHVNPGTKGKKAGDKTLTVTQAANQPYLWDEQEIATAIKRFQAAGIKEVTDFDTLAKAWGGLVQRAGAMYSLSSGERKVTPWDVLDLYKNERLLGPAEKLGPGDPGFNGTITQVARSVSDISEGDAFAALQTTLSNMLGHDPDDHELRDFTYRMNSLAAHNPSITKTIQRYKDGQIASTSSHTSAGFNSNDMAERAYRRAQSDPDYADYQAATTYFNAAASALGPIGG